MFTPEKMIQIHVVFSMVDVDRVSETVVRQGSLQVVDAADMESWAKNLSRGGSGEESNEMRSRREKIQNLIKGLHISDVLENVESSEESWATVDHRLEEIERNFDYQKNAVEQLNQEKERLLEFLSRIDSLTGLEMPLKQRDKFSYLAVEVGHISEENMPLLKSKLESMIHVVTVLGKVGSMTRVAIMALKRDSDALKTILRETAFEAAPLDDMDSALSPDMAKKLDKKLDENREQQFKIQEKLDILATNEEGFLRSVLLKVRRDLLKRRLLRYYRKTERTFLLSGWIPETQQDDFEQRIRKATQNRCIVEKVAAEEIPSVREGKMHVPVALKNPKFIKPFEILTKTYGIPSYASVDPTPLLGVSFLIMFGVMFGDIGHGLILALGGLWMFLKGKRLTLKNAGLLLSYAGISSIIFGFLFGSIFGLEDVIPALWLHPMASISKLFQTAIYFGIGMITMAIVVNIINGIRRRDILGLIFDKAGLLAAVLYWCGIIVVTRVVMADTGSRGEVPALISILMIGSVVLLFLREPIIHLIQGKKKLFPEGLATGIMGAIVELLEIFLGFLANTVSFIRVAAFGLAHAGLFMAIFALSDAVGGVGSGFVLFFGNLLIIGLEGLVVSIQAVRLEFYEFFSRFFQEGEAGYKPLEAELRA